MNRLLLLLAFICLSITVKSQDLQPWYLVSHHQGCAPFTVNFKDTSYSRIGAITARYWDFGDGSTGTGEQLQHTYAQNGIYFTRLVIATASGDSAAYTDPNPVRVGVALQLPHTVAICGTSFNVTLKNLLAPAAGDSLGTYEWDTYLGIVTTPVIKNVTAGYYLLNYSACGDVIQDSTVVYDTKNTTVRLDTIGTAHWVNDVMRIMFREQITFPTSFIARRYYSWGDGKDTSTYNGQTAPYHNYTKSGTFNLRFTTNVKDSFRATSCMDTSYATTTVVRAPYVNHNYWNGRDTLLIPGTTLWLNAGGSQSSYGWFSDVTPIASNDSTIGITIPGKYWVKISRNGDIITDTINVRRVDSSSLHAVIKIVSQQCNVVTFVDSSTSYNYPIVKREWDFGVTPGTDYYMPSFTYQANGQYPVKLIVHNSVGATDTAYTYVNINAFPSVALLKGDTISLTPGDTVSLRNWLPDTGYKYHWSTGDTTSSILVNAAGKYVLTAAYCGHYASDSVYVKEGGDTAHLAFSYSMPSACDPGLVAFKNLSTSPDDPIVSYNWNFGNGTTSNEKDPSLHYTKSNIYLITLNTTTASGVRSVISKTISVRLDKWQLHAQIDDIRSGYTCSDTALLSAYAEGTEEHEYTITWNKPLAYDIMVFSSGIYTAYLKDSCGNIRDTSVVNVVMNGPLAAAIQPVHDTLFGSHSVFNSPLNVTYTWQWYRNDTLLQGNNLPYYVIRNQPKGTYKLVVTNSLGCTATSPVYTNTINLSVDYTYKISSCDAQNITFNGIVRGDSIAAYNWSIGNGSHWTTKNTAIRFPTPGPYDVTFAVRSIYGDTASITKHLVIPQVAAWTAKINRTGAACSDTVVLTVETNFAAGAFHWSNGATTRSITVTGGTYVVDVLDSCNTVRARDTAEVLYNVPFTARIELGRGYQDTLYAFPALNTSTYTWFRNGQQIDQHGWMIFPQEEGTYTVAILSERGCTNTSAPFVYTFAVDTVTLPATGTVNGNDSLPVTTSFNHDFNAGNVFTAQLMLDNSGGRNTGLSDNEIIDLGSVSGTSRNVAMNVAIPDSLACASNYIIRITASSPADTTSWSKQFAIVNQPPAPGIIQRGDSLYTAGHYNWQWYKNNVAIEGATDASYRARANGNYRVEASNGSGCVSSSTTLAVIITAVEEVTLGDTRVRIYPNPSDGPVRLEFSKALLKPVVVRVHDLRGRILYGHTTQLRIETLDLGTLPKGYYLVEISGFGTSKVLKLILE